MAAPNGGSLMKRVRLVKQRGRADRLIYPGIFVKDFVQ
jgi:hypothetical protein